MKEIYLTIVSPERTLFEGKVAWVTCPGTAGKFQVLPDHAPLISSLAEGEVRFVKAGTSQEKKDETQTVAIKGGFVEVRDNRVSVCAEQ